MYNFLINCERIWGTHANKIGDDGNDVDWVCYGNTLFSEWSPIKCREVINQGGSKYFWYNVYAGAMIFGIRIRGCNDFWHAQKDAHIILTKVSK